MKQLTKIILVILILSKNLYFSQGTAKGLYKNSDDFLKGKMIYTERQSRIRLHDLFKKKIVTVKQNDSSFTLLKSELYGYKDKEGISYRFYKDTIYTILNPTESIILYKRTSGTGMKNSPETESYFFSKEAGSLLLTLTLVNMEKVFSTLPSFTKLLEFTFHYDDDLITYDQQHTKFKINRLLELSENEKH